MTHQYISPVSAEAARAVEAGSTSTDLGASRSRSARETTRSALTNQRGAAVFIVLMAVTLLTAVGLYAARATTLVDQGAGYDRQAMQAHYLAVYATLATSSELSGTRGQSPIREGIARPDTNCPSLLGVPPSATLYCHQLTMDELANSVDTNFSGHQLLEKAQNGSPFVPGSLGPYPPSTGAAINGFFTVELTEFADLPTPPGYPAGSGDMVLYDVTVTTHGTIGQSSTTCDGNSTVAGEEQLRAHVIAGPMKRN